MTNEVVTLKDALSFEQIAILSGQDAFGGKGGSSLPFLTINTLAEDDDGHTLIPGSFTAEIAGVGRVYSKNIKFRPLLRGFQYRRFDDEAMKNVSKTRIIRNWSEEAYDTAGTIRCGRPKLGKNEVPTPEQKALIDQISCFMLLFGVVTFVDPTNTKGEKVDVEPTPVLFRCRGLNYMHMGTLLDLLFKKHRDMMRTEIAITTKREKNGGNIYYVVVPTVDFTAPLVWNGDADFNLFLDFNDYINTVNAGILEEYKKAVSGVAATKDAQETVTLVEAKATLLNDLADDNLDDIGRPSIIAAG